MSDPDLQRQRRESELPLAEQVALLNARLRAGDLHESRLLLAAYAGALVAQASLGLPLRAEADAEREEHTRRILAIRWTGVRSEAPDDLFVAEAVDDPVLNRLCPRWQGALILAANVPEVTGFLLQARSGGALNVTRGRERRPPTQVAEADRRQALAAARQQIEAEGLRFEAEDEVLQRELLALGDWRAPRTVAVWFEGFRYFGPQAHLRAHVAWAQACVAGLPAALRPPLEALVTLALGSQDAPGEESRHLARAALPRAEALVTETSPDERLGVAARRVRAALAEAGGEPDPRGDSADPLAGEEELALLSEGRAIAAALSAWALSGADTASALA